MQWILIEDEVYQINTAQEIAAAQAAMQAAGLTQADVWVGDPDSPADTDTYRNGRTLFA
jgi:hypothetical protein